jgi:hypothetical protein
MDQIGKLDGILDEEDWNIVSDKVPVSFFGIKLDGKSTYVTRGIY